METVQLLSITQADFSTTMIDRVNSSVCKTWTSKTHVLQTMTMYTLRLHLNNKSTF